MRSRISSTESWPFPSCCPTANTVFHELQSYEGTSKGYSEPTTALHYFWTIWARSTNTLAAFKLMKWLILPLTDLETWISGALLSLLFRWQEVQLYCSVFSTCQWRRQTFGDSSNFFCFHSSFFEVQSLDLLICPSMSHAKPLRQHSLALESPGDLELCRTA